MSKKIILDFLMAALPWVVLGLVLLYCILSVNKSKKKEKANHGSEGMSVGMCLRIARLGRAESMKSIF